jgi:hypothetical protein
VEDPPNAEPCTDWLIVRKQRHSGDRHDERPVLAHEPEHAKPRIVFKAEPNVRARLAAVSLLCLGPSVGEGRRAVARVPIVADGAIAAPLGGALPGDPDCLGAVEEDVHRGRGGDDLDPAADRVVLNLPAEEPRDPFGNARAGGSDAPGREDARAVAVRGAVAEPAGERRPG